MSRFLICERRLRSSLCCFLPRPEGEEELFRGELPSPLGALRRDEECGEGEEAKPGPVEREIEVEFVFFSTSCEPEADFFN